MEEGLLIIMKPDVRIIDKFVGVSIDSQTNFFELSLGKFLKTLKTVNSILKSYEFENIPL